MNKRGEVMYPVEYSAMVYDEMEYNTEQVYGITFANSYAEAMEKIEKYYGNTIIDIRLFMQEENSVYELNQASIFSPSHGMLRIENISTFK